MASAHDRTGEGCTRCTASGDGDSVGWIHGARTGKVNSTMYTTNKLVISMEVALVADILANKSDAWMKDEQCE